MEYLKLFLMGGVIGVANIIPGVSGGTMAVVMGIYERLIGAISNFFTDRENLKSNFIFLAIIGLGSLTAIGSLARVMDYLLEYHKILTHMFFIGLIAGSIPAVFRSHNNMKLCPTSAISFLGGLLLIVGFTYFFGHLEKPEDFSFNYQITAGGLAMLAIAGFFAGGSMIVPGISGSLVMLMLGQYKIVIKAIKEFNLVPLGVVAVGVSIGILGFAKFIEYCLARFPKETVYFILGLVIGSLYPIWPGLPAAGGAIAAAFGLMLLGGAIAYFLGER